MQHSMKVLLPFSIHSLSVEHLIIILYRVDVWWGGNFVVDHTMSYKTVKIEIT